MTISKIDNARLRNDEHFQFHTEFKDLVIKYGAETLKVKSQFETYLSLYEKEDEGVKKINKSALTAEIQDADKARDEIWNGIIKMNNAALKHFDADVQKAAGRLKIVFDTYGNISRKPLNEQTSAVYNVLQELQGKYAADVKAVGIEEWVNELLARNEVFSALVKDRYDETSLKTDVILKDARALLDKAYFTITDRIGAFVLLEGAELHEPFIRSLNVVIDKYNAALARRLGKKKAEQ